MKKNKILGMFCLLLYLCTAPVLAQIKGSEIRVVVSPDHTDWTYQLKEKCTFTV